MAKKKRTASQVGKSNANTSKVHERRCAKLLTDWAGVDFRRRRNQGRGEDTVARDSAGDIITVNLDDLCRFNIECKKEKNFSIDAMMSNPTGNKFTKWLHQATYDANICSAHIWRKLVERKSSACYGMTGEKIDHIDCMALPFLFFKPNPNTDWVAFPVKSMLFLRPKTGAACCPKRTGIWFPAFQYTEFERTGPISHNVSHGKNQHAESLVLSPCYLCRWKDFAENVLPESFFFHLR